MAGKDFEGFVVVVTGGSTGLGRAVAVETAARDAWVEIEPSLRRIVQIVLPGESIPAINPQSEAGHAL